MTELRCKNCGGTEIIMKDNGKFICSSCGVTYEKEQIDKMRVSVDGKVEVDGIASLDKLLKNGNTYLSLGEYEKARKVFNQISREYPEDYRGWEGIMKASLSMDVVPNLNVLNNLEKLAPVEIYSDIKREYSAKLDKIHKENSEFINAVDELQIILQKTKKEINDKSSNGSTILSLLGGIGMGIFFWFLGTPDTNSYGVSESDIWYSQGMRTVGGLLIAAGVFFIACVIFTVKSDQDIKASHYIHINFKALIPKMKKKLESVGVKCAYDERAGIIEKFDSLDFDALSELLEETSTDNKRLELIKSKLL